MEIDRPEALESCRLDNASGSSLSVVMDDDFDDDMKRRRSSAVTAAAAAAAMQTSTTRARLDSSPTVHSVYQYQQHSSSCALASCSIDNAPGSSSSVVLAFPFGLAPA